MRARALLLVGLEFFFVLLAGARKKNFEGCMFLNFLGSDTPKNWQSRKKHEHQNP